MATVKYCRYKFQNLQALRNVALAIETGRLPTPSPPRSTEGESTDDDIKERKVRDVHMERKQMETSKAVVVQARKVESSDIAKLGDSIGESSRVLWTRKQIEVVAKEATDSSDEEGDIVIDTDKDFVESNTTVDSSSTSESEYSEEDDEEVNEESDTELEDEGEGDNRKNVPSRGSVDRNGLVVNTNPDNILAQHKIHSPVPAHRSKEEERPSSKTRRKVIVFHVVVVFVVEVGKP